MKLIRNANKNQYNKIIAWLSNEKLKGNGGFYSHLEKIKESFYEGQLLIYEKEGKSLGFITWTKNSFENGAYVDLNIMAIKPEYRRKGVGQEFYKSAESYFVNQGLIAIKLFCSPADSESFWLKMGFMKFPSTGSEHHLTYYKPLLLYNKPHQQKSKNMIELWNVESYKAFEYASKWTWKMNSDFKSIIQPCNSNWNLRLTQKGKVVKEDKVKYFTSTVDEIKVGSFLYIDQQKLDLIKTESSFKF